MCPGATLRTVVHHRQLVGDAQSPIDVPNPGDHSNAHFREYDAGAGAYDRLTGRWSRMYVDRVLDVARREARQARPRRGYRYGDAAITTAIVSAIWVG